MHAENDEDDTVGYIYISGGTLDINAVDDGIHGTTYIQIDGGTMNINAGEGIEATYVQVNDGNITINASDDGINASQKSSAIEPVLQGTGRHRCARLQRLHLHQRWYGGHQRPVCL